MAMAVVEGKESFEHIDNAVCDSRGFTDAASMPASGSGTRIDASGRKEKRKALKKMKRKQYRQQIAELEKLEEEALLQDPAEQEELEAQAEELERKKHEEQMRIWLEREQQAKEEAARREEEEQLKEKEAKERKEEESDSDYVEDGPAEIIWEGNEITVKKRKVKVDKSEAKITEVTDRPTSNPPPPQSTVNYRSLYAGLDQNPNYGTEQDKTHCPFHIKTGACRFGARCSRVHVYPEKSCTLLIKNMYTGPGLAWEHDEGLEEGAFINKPVYILLLVCSSLIVLLNGAFEKLVIRLPWDSISKVVEVNTPYTDEEVAEQYEEFYEDVHSEFLKFGELVNFKVCRNGSPHLRGNVYVHYRFEDCAVAAYNALCGRFYASKQIIPECVAVTRWKVAICGEYMRAHHGTCSRGTACNFLHCFRNPGGEYDWANWDAPPPRAWQRKMASLFGYQGIHQDSEHYRESERDGRDRRETERDKLKHKKERQVRSKHEDRNNSGENRRHARKAKKHSDSEDEYERPRDGYRSHSDDSGGEYNNRHRGRSEKERERWPSKKVRAVSERSHRSSWDKVTQRSDRWQGGM